HRAGLNSETVHRLCRESQSLDFLAGRVTDLDGLGCFLVFGAMARRIRHHQAHRGDEHRRHHAFLQGRHRCYSTVGSGVAANSILAHITGRMNNVKMIAPTMPGIMMADRDGASARPGASCDRAKGRSAAAATSVEERIGTTRWLAPSTMISHLVPARPSAASFLTWRSKSMPFLTATPSTANNPASA